jgi:tape measure domain-containing protein
MGFARNALVAIAALDVIKGISELADEFTRLQNKITYLTPTVQGQQAVMAALAQTAYETRTGLEATGNMFFRVTQATLGMHLSFSDLIGVTKEFNQIAKISGVSTQELNNVIKDLTHGFGQGELQGRQLRAILQQMPILANIIGKEFGVTGAQLLHLSQATPGIITIDRVIKALKDHADELGVAFGKTQPTIADGFTKLHTAIVLFMGGLNQTVGLGQTFNAMIDVIINHISELAFVLLGLATIAAFNFLTSQIVMFGETLGGVLGFAASGFLNLATILTYPARAVGGLAVVFAELSISVGSFVIAGVEGMVAFGASVAAGAGRAVVLFGALAESMALGLVSFGELAAMAAKDIWSFMVQGIKGVVTGLIEMSVAFLTNPLFIGGAIIIGALTVAWILFKDQILAIIPSMDEVKKGFNDLMAYGVSAVQTLIDDWRLFPDALADLMIQAANSAIAELEKFGNLAGDLINHLLPKSLEIPKIDVNDNTIDNTFAGSADKVANTFNKHLEENLKTNWGQKIVDTTKGAMDQLQSFVKPTSNIDLSKMFPTGSTDAAALSIDKLKGKLKTLLESVSPLIKDSLTLKDAELAVAAGASEIAKAGLTQEEVMKRIERSVLGAGNAITDADEKLILLKKGLADKSIDQNEFDKLSKSIYGFDTAAEQAKVKQDLLTEGFKKGVVDVDTYNDAWQKLQATMLLNDNPHDMFAGIQAGLLDLQQSYQDVAKGMADATKNAFDGMTNQLSDFIVKGKADFGSLAQSIESDLVKIALKGAIEAPFLNAINGAMGQSKNSTGSFFGDLFSGQSEGSKSAIGDIGSLFGSGSSATSATANLTTGAASASGGGWLSSLGSMIGSAFADGGEFQVGGQGGTDSQLVAFRASPDETVSVKKPGQQGQAPQKTEVHLHVYGVQDADSFMRSRSQVEAAIGVGINRSVQRNTSARSGQRNQR